MQPVARSNNAAHQFHGVQRKCFHRLLATGNSGATNAPLDAAWAESRFKACVSFWLLNGSIAAALTYASGLNCLGAGIGATLGRVWLRSAPPSIDEHHPLWRHRNRQAARQAPSIQQRCRKAFISWPPSVQLPCAAQQLHQIEITECLGSGIHHQRTICLGAIVKIVQGHDAGKIGNVRGKSANIVIAALTLIAMGNSA